MELQNEELRSTACPNFWLLVAQTPLLHVLPEVPERIPASPEL